MFKFIKDMFTEVDGESFDINRILYAIAVLSFTGIAWWAVIVNKQPAAWLELGGGFGAVLAGGGGSLAFNRKQEVAAPVALSTPVVVPAVAPVENADGAQQ